MKASTSTTDDEELISLEGGIAVIDFNFRSILLMKLAVRDFSDFWEEAVEVVHTHIVKILCLHFKFKS